MFIQCFPHYARTKLTKYNFQDFKVDTFEYRLLREVSFRETVTRRFTNEVDTQMSTVIDRSLGPPSAPQVHQKPRNSKLQEGSDAAFTIKVAANPKPRVSTDSTSHK